jgi:riboflavin kinase/FMN adenylyltransferase
MPPAIIEINAETEVEIHFLDRIRDEVKFPSVEMLREQIGKDIGRARRYLHLLAARKIAF